MHKIESELFRRMSARPPDADSPAYRPVSISTMTGDTFDEEESSDDEIDPVLVQKYKNHVTSTKIVPAPASAPAAPVSPLPRTREGRVPSPERVKNGLIVEEVHHRFASPSHPYFEYFRLCKLHQLAVNPGAATCLYVRSPVLKLTRTPQFSELDLIPVVELLRVNMAPFVEELDLSGLRLGSVAALVLGGLLSHGASNIKSLNISRNLLRDEGAAEIFKSMKENSRIVKVNLSSNRVKISGAKIISTYIDNGYVPNLNELVVRNNSMQQTGVDLMLNSCEKRHICCAVEGNHVLSEILNTLTHGIGLIAAIVGGVEMLYRGSDLDNGLFAAVFTFVLSLCVMFASSSLYHSFFRLGSARNIFQVMDHCSIFFLIAGTYTPFLLKFIWSKNHPNSLLGPVIFYLVWGFAFLGILFSATRLKKSVSSKHRAYLAMLMGWLVIVSLKTMWERMPRKCIMLLFAGGLWYSVGVPVYIKGQEVSIYHVLWHICVMGGAACHYFGVLYYVVL